MLQPNDNTLDVDWAIKTIRHRVISNKAMNHLLQDVVAEKFNADSKPLA